MVGKVRKSFYDWIGPNRSGNEFCSRRWWEKFGKVFTTGLGIYIYTPQTSVLWKLFRASGHLLGFYGGKGGESLKAELLQQRGVCIMAFFSLRFPKELLEQRCGVCTMAFFSLPFPRQNILFTG